MLIVQTQRLIVCRMNVTCPPGGKEHLDAHHDKDRCHGYEAWHGCVALVPEVREAGIGERLKSGGEKVDKSRGDEDTCSKVSREEEEFVGYGYRRKAPDDNGERASRSTQE